MMEKIKYDMEAAPRGVKLLAWGQWHGEMTGRDPERDGPFVAVKSGDAPWRVEGTDKFAAWVQPWAWAYISTPRRPETGVAE